MKMANCGGLCWQIHQSFYTFYETRTLNCVSLAAKEACSKVVDVVADVKVGVKEKPRRQFSDS